MLIKCILLLFVLSFVEAEISYYRSSKSSCTIPRIKNGRARLRQRGTFLKYTCFNRYTLVGNTYATCRYGHWDTPAPVCVKTGCPQLEEVKNSVNMTSHNDAWVIFFCLPGHVLVGSPVLYCDGTQWNSTAPGCYDSTKTHSETECDFEQPDICGWKPDEYHDFDWRRNNKKTPSSFLQTGPSFDHTYGKNGSGYYMYVESTGKIENETARLFSPVYEADLAKDGCFVFWYHMFGRSMGGLVIYQKPDKLSIFQLKMQQYRTRYMLFEQWGDQGNDWYSAVAMLSDVGDDFQIVVEGIRGDSFMSDIAIDDVSIQHDENCTAAISKAITPPSVFQESCVGRCDLNAEATGFRGCSCAIICVAYQNCCPDFLDVCDSDSRETPSLLSSTSESYLQVNSSLLPPQTQKLIATTTETLPPAQASTTKSVTTSTTTRRPPPPVVYTATTTTTTQRPTTTTKSPTTTTKRPTTTTKRPTTTTKRQTTTKRPATTKMTTTTTKKPVTTTTTKKIIPRNPTTVLRPIFTRKSTTWTFEVTPMSSSTIFVAQTSNHQVMTISSKRGMSGATVAITVLLVGLVFVGMLWGVFVATRSRGVAALARIRGRTTNDPEVHYLKTDDDDEFE